MDFIWQYVTESSAIIHVGISITIVSVLFVLLLAFTVIAIRLNIYFKSIRQRAVIHTWRPVLSHVAIGKPVRFPSIAPEDIPYFLIEWNSVYGTIRGENIKQLQNLAVRLELDRYSLKIIQSGKMQHKLLGIVTLGNMRCKTAWDGLRELMLNARQSIVAISAARALLMIDPKASSISILPSLVSNKTWPWSNIAHALKLAGPDNICDPLSDMIHSKPPEIQSRVLRFMEVVKCEVITDAVTQLLKVTKDDKVASVCLQIIRDAGAVDLVKSYLAHPRWHVRMHAATALGKIGGSNNVADLVKLLEDKEWWVRYRSAQSIARLMSMNIEELTALEATIEDRYGRDMIKHVIAEINSGHDHY